MIMMMKTTGQISGGTIGQATGQATDPSTGQFAKAKGAIQFNWDAQASQAACRTANHNLTHDARHSNVVVLGGPCGKPDFRPDQGARMVLAA